MSTSTPSGPAHAATATAHASPAPSGAVPGPADEALELLDAAGWTAVVDELVAGACHELNGRASALYGLSELNKDPQDGAFVTESLATEADRLRTLGSAMRVMSSRGRTAVEPMALREHLDDVVRLFHMQPGMELLETDVVIDPSTPAVVVPWAVLGRAILLALNGVAANGILAGRRLLRIEHGPGPGCGLLTITASQSAEAMFGDPATTDVASRFAAWPQSLTRVFEMLGGQVRPELEPQREGAGPRVEIRLPILDGS